MIPLQAVHADRGLIPVTASVSIYEPGQKAILAWNGHEQIMILSTNVVSGGETLLLEVMPLPSQPAVEAASVQSFEEIQNLIYGEGTSLYHFGTRNDATSKTVEVVFNEQIGAHNITVVKAANTAELVDWADTFLAGSGLTQQISLGKFESAVRAYMSRGFRYYALDLITVSPAEKSVEPLLYRFNSSFLYYPLLITSPVVGNTDITLFLLTKGKVVADYMPFYKAYYKLSSWNHPPIEFVLSKGDLSRIDLRIGELFQDEAWLSVLRYKGSAGLLTDDLMISEKALFPTVGSSGNEVVMPTALVVLCIALGAVAALAGVVVTFLITRSKKT
jgi:hypothetical protein